MPLFAVLAVGALVFALARSLSHGYNAISSRHLDPDDLNGPDDKWDYEPDPITGEVVYPRSDPRYVPEDRR